MLFVFLGVVVVVVVIVAVVVVFDVFGVCSFV